MSRWESMMLADDADRANCMGWFNGLLSEAWGQPLKAEHLPHPSGESTKAIRVLFRQRDGSFWQAERRFHKRGYSILMGPPCKGILNGFNSL